MIKLDLNGEWRFNKSGDEVSYPASVPGCNYLDLMQNGLLLDPFIGENEKQSYRPALSDWEYSRTFTADAELINCDAAVLTCDMLDTVADIYVNERLAGQAENCHVCYETDIKHLLKEGENRIKIVFYSPVRYVEQKYAAEKCPDNCNGQNGIPHIRKPQCHFGWDWGPVLPPSGISGDICVIGRKKARIERVDIEQYHGEGEVLISVKTLSFAYKTCNAAYRLRVIQPDGTELIRENANGEFDIRIANPQYWWTYELSKKQKQPLYTVNVELISDGETTDSVSKKIGLRTIKLDRSPDEAGENFQFVLNGVPIFVKGANWIPPDSFITRYTEERLRYDFDAARFSNINMLRIWGGGYYADEKFLDAADEYGILVWQDFQFACQAYPFFDDALLYNVKKEIRYNALRMRDRACLALWCGNNEIEAMSGGWLLKRKYIEWTEKFFYHILPSELAVYDKVTPFISGSPIGVSHMKGHDKDNVGDTHLWAVWHGLQPMNYYRKRLTRFCSEFGFESLPDLKTIQKFATVKDYSLKSPVFNAHQKCKSGNMKMAYYIASRFNVPKNFTDYIYLSQICQQECIKDAVEHWRRNKGRCNGAMYWQYNDCWPVCSWSGMDYYGNYKALQYTARHFYAPFAVSIEDDENGVSVYVLNDENKKRSAKVVVRVTDFYGEVKLEKIIAADIAALEVKKIACLLIKDLRKLGKLKEFVFSAELIEDGKRVNVKTALFDKEKNVNLPRPEMRYSVKIKDNTAIITLTADKYVRLLQLYSDVENAPFSDNYFDILSGETVEITQRVGASATEDEYAAALKLFSAADIVPSGGKMKNILLRASVLLKPANWSSYLYNKRVPTDYKTTSN